MSPYASDLVELMVSIYLHVIVPSVTSIESFTFTERCWMWNTPASYADAEISPCRRFCFSLFCPVLLCTPLEMHQWEMHLDGFPNSSAEMAVVYSLGCCRQPQKRTQLVQASFGFCLGDITVLVGRIEALVCRRQRRLFPLHLLQDFNITFCSTVLLLSEQWHVAQREVFWLGMCDGLHA